MPYAAQASRLSVLAGRAAGSLLLVLLFAPASDAQLYAGLGGGYARLDDVPRYGATVAFYVPAFDHALDVVPSFEYYYRKWNDGPTEVGTFWAAGLEVRLNLPPVLRLVRPYAGTGFSLAGVDGETRFGLHLVAGTYVRLFVRDVYPFIQADYHVTEEFDEVNLLDTVFFHTGVRFVIL